MFCFARSACAHPLIDFRNHEFPKATHLVGWQLLSFDPFVNGVTVDTQVSRDFFNRLPPLFHDLCDSFVRLAQNARC